MLPAGGSQLGQVLCRAVETYGGQARYQQPLLGMLSALLATPQAQALSGLRGGDADPEAAQVRHLRWGALGCPGRTGVLDLGCGFSGVLSGGGA
jgi:hypothetical protein